MLRSRRLVVCWSTLLLPAFLIFPLVVVFSPRLYAVDGWDGPAFSASPDALHQAAAAVKSDKDTDATILLNEEQFSFDGEGRMVDTYHAIYRIETEDGVRGWAEVSSQWEPWHQSKPEVRARVISPDGATHTLDQKTLTDVPVHENSPETFSDQRAYGGPLPAIAVGAIVEEEITTRDTTPFFTAGLVQRLSLEKFVPVHETRMVLSHPESLPLRYFVHEMPDAKVVKSAENGVETIEIENGPMEPIREKLTDFPPDVIPGPEIEFSTGTSWQQVSAEYVRLSNGKLRTADVQPFLGSLKSDHSATRKELISRLVSALHKNVRYTGVEFGEASIIPQFPEETLKRKYGDCKDKAALLATLLRASGIPASLALLDTGPGQDVNPDLPGMGMFDHAIVYVPASGKEEELWIDATAQYSRVGELPYMDYGRWALVVDAATTALKKIPELTADKNVHREFREFSFAGFGPATIIEKNEDIGPGEAGYRETYANEDKQLRDNVEGYVKRAYLSEKLTSLQHGDVADLDKQFWVTFTAKGRRGSTDYDNAIMAIRVEDLFNGLPDYFTTASKETRKDEGEESPAEKRTPRTKDWQIRPFTNQWNYKIVAPPGYKVRALPQTIEEQLGTARFTQKYISNPEGTVVEAVLRFENRRTRLSVAEAKSLRDAIVKARQADPIFIAFDQTGKSLLAEGKIREGLESYQKLIDLYPKQALHRIQFARALLSVGLGEKARTVARQATAMEPNSAQAFSTLGWILQHDLIGRRLRKGFDYEAAVAAYRKAKALDPKDKQLRANLAILLEYDADGERYTAKSHLREAVSELRELKKMDEDYAAQYDDNVLYDLWYARDVEGVADAVAKLPATDVRRGFAIAAVAAEQGADAAIKRSVEVTTEEQVRSKALTSAGWLLVHVYNYSAGADLLAAGARGQSNEARSNAYAALLKKAIPREKFKPDPSIPNSAVQRFYSVAFSTPADYDHMKALMSKNANRKPDPKKDREEYGKEMSRMREQLEKSGLPLEIIGDIAIQNMRFSSEGSDSAGYKITAIAAGTAPQEVFIVREDGSYKILDLTVSTNQVPQHLGWQALQELNSNNLPGARQWLDRAREQVHISENDDPLAGQPFPHFWSKGQKGDATAIRMAALTLAPSKELRREDIAVLLHMRDAAADREEKGRLDVVIAHALQAQELWSDMAPIAERLTRAYPDSLTAFQFAAAAYAGTGNLDAWQKLLDERLASHPDEIDYTRSAARLAQYRKDFVRSRQLLKGLIDSGKATQADLNLYAWNALFTGSQIDHDSIEAAERANDLSHNSNFSIMHTLACLYARAGKPAQARDVLLKAMDAAYLDAPDSSVWLAYGVIAEAYGEADAARAMYARVEKLTTEAPGSNYQLAQQRLASMPIGDSAEAASGSRQE